MEFISFREDQWRSNGWLHCKGEAVARSYFHINVQSTWTCLIKVLLWSLCILSRMILIYTKVLQVSWQILLSLELRLDFLTMWKLLVCQIYTFNHSWGKHSFQYYIDFQDRAHCYQKKRKKKTGLMTSKSKPCESCWGGPLNKPKK